MIQAQQRTWNHDRGTPSTNERFLSIGIRPRGKTLLWLLIVMISSARATFAQGTAAPFYMGADVSLESFMQQQGVVFKDNGVAAPLDQILYNHGDNLYRLRIFVNPQTTYTSSASGAMQTQAYDIALGATDQGERSER